MPDPLFRGAVGLRNARRVTRPGAWEAVVVGVEDPEGRERNERDGAALSLAAPITPSSDSGGVGACSLVPGPVSLDEFKREEIRLEASSEGPAGGGVDATLAAGVDRALARVRRRAVTGGVAMGSC